MIAVHKKNMVKINIWTDSGLNYTPTPVDAQFLEWKKIQKIGAAGYKVVLVSSQ